MMLACVYFIHRGVCFYSESLSVQCCLAKEYNAAANVIVQIDDVTVELTPEIYK